MLAASIRADLFQSIRSGSAGPLSSCVLHSYVSLYAFTNLESAEFFYSKKDCNGSESGLIWSSGVPDFDIWDKGRAWASFKCDRSSSV